MRWDREEGSLVGFGIADEGGDVGGGEESIGEDLGRGEAAWKSVDVIIVAWGHLSIR